MNFFGAALDAVATAIDDLLVPSDDTTSPDRGPTHNNSAASVRAGSAHGAYADPLAVHQRLRLAQARHDRWACRDGPRGVWTAHEVARFLHAGAGPAAPAAPSAAAVDPLQANARPAGEPPFTVALYAVRCEQDARRLLAALQCWTGLAGGYTWPIDAEASYLDDATDLAQETTTTKAAALSSDAAVPIADDPSAGPQDGCDALLAELLLSAPSMLARAPCAMLLHAKLLRTHTTLLRTARPSDPHEETAPAASASAATADTDRCRRQTQRATARRATLQGLLSLHCVLLASTSHIFRRLNGLPVDLPDAELLAFLRLGSSFRVLLPRFVAVLEEGINGSGGGLSLKGQGNLAIDDDDDDDTDQSSDGDGADGILTGEGRARGKQRAAEYADLIAVDESLRAARDADLFVRALWSLSPKSHDRWTAFCVRELQPFLLHLLLAAGPALSTSSSPSGPSNAPIAGLVPPPPRNSCARVSFQTAVRAAAILPSGAQHDLFDVDSVESATMAGGHATTAGECRLHLPPVYRQQLLDWLRLRLVPLSSVQHPPRSLLAVFQSRNAEFFGLLVTFSSSHISPLEAGLPHVASLKVDGVLDATLCTFSPEFTTARLRAGPADADGSEASLLLQYTADEANGTRRIALAAVPAAHSRKGSSASSVEMILDARISIPSSSSSSVLVNHTAVSRLAVPFMAVATTGAGFALGVSTVDDRATLAAACAMLLSWPPSASSHEQTDMHGALSIGIGDGDAIASPTNAGEHNPVLRAAPRAPPPSLVSPTKKMEKLPQPQDAVAPAANRSSPAAAGGARSPDHAASVSPAPPSDEFVMVDQDEAASIGNVGQQFRTVSSVESEFDVV